MFKRFQLKEKIPTNEFKLTRNTTFKILLDISQKQNALKTGLTTDNTLVYITSLKFSLTFLTAYVGYTYQTLDKFYVKDVI